MINKISILSSVAIWGFSPNINLSTKIFHSSRTQTYKISSSNFFLLMSTTESQIGYVDRNAKLGFRSSWGVWNRAESDGEFVFNISKQTILEHLGLKNKPNVTLKSFKPTKIGFLPIIAITDPPIVNAYWTTDQVKFNGYSSSIYQDTKQKLPLPKGHAVGTEWWKGITSFGSLVTGAIIATIIGWISQGTLAGVGLRLAMWVAKGSFGIGIIKGALVNHFFQKWQANKIKEKRVIAEKIYNTIMTDPINIYANAIDFTNQDSTRLRVEGKLFGEANATSIWGDNSEIHVDNVLTAVNGEVEIEETING